MSAFRNPDRVRRAAPAVPLMLGLVLAVPATGQERSATPLISVDAGFTAATAPSPDAVRPVARKINLRDAVAQALERNATARVAAADIRRAGGLMEQVRAASLPTLGVNATYTRLNKDRTFQATGTDGGTENVVVAAKGLDQHHRLADHPHPRAAGLGRLDEGRRQSRELQVLRAGRAADGGRHHRARLPHRLRPEAPGRGEPPGPGQLAGAHAVRRLSAPRRNRQPGRLGPRRAGPGAERGAAPEQLREPVPHPGGAGHPPRRGPAGRHGGRSGNSGDAHDRPRPWRSHRAGPTSCSSGSRRRPPTAPST